MDLQCSLVFPVEVVVHSHDPKGAAGDLLVEKEHEGSSQHCLQQLGLQAFEQAQYAVLPVEKLNMLHFNHAKAILKYTVLKMILFSCHNPDYLIWIGQIPIYNK